MSKHHFNNTKVANLEPSDFSGKTLTIKGQNMPGKTSALVWASYCGHCNTVAPIFAKLASRNNKNTIDDYSITITAVQGDSKDPSDKETLAILQNLTPIRGYPTILIFKNGEFSYQYNGDRTVEAIESDLKRL
jgi:thiol-disulfide isomerase/thioredoxin